MPGDSQFIGREFNGFKVESLLGQGGMGAVYKATQLNLHRPVAIKVIEGVRGIHLEQFRIRFEREAQAAAKVSHPNIVQVYDYGEIGGQLYLVMEYVQGQGLDEVLRERSRLPEVEALDLIRQAAVGLGVAHDAGIVHRDIKPGNLMLDQHGIVKVADFGLATGDDGFNTLTKTGQVLGTPAYMAPEQMLGEKVDQRADLYSLGIALFELITGARPFTGETPIALISKRLTASGKIVDPRDVRADTPEPVRVLLLKMMAVARDARHQTAAGLIADIDATRAALSAAPAQPPEPAAPSPSVVLDTPDPTLLVVEDTIADSALATDAPPLTPDPLPVPASKWPMLVVLLLVLIAAPVGWFLASGMGGGAADERGGIDQVEAARVADAASAAEAKRVADAAQAAEAKRAADAAQAAEAKRVADAAQAAEAKRAADAAQAAEAKRVADAAQAAEAQRLAAAATAADAALADARADLRKGEHVRATAALDRARELGVAGLEPRIEALSTSLAAYVTALSGLRRHRDRGENIAARDCGRRALAIAPDDDSVPAMLADIGEAPDGLAYDRRDSANRRLFSSPTGHTMLPVAAGEYPLGRSGGPGDESPRHTVTLSLFFIDRDEVTNTQYGRFLAWAATAQDAHAHCHADEPADKDHTPAFWSLQGWNDGGRPIVGVDWYDAYAYARWAQLSLPSEAQWEAAARGQAGSLYPWGSTADTNRANVGERYLGGKDVTPADWRAHMDRVAARTVTTMAAGTLPAGTAVCGARDMAGNVWEWCLDVYDGAAYRRREGPDPLHGGAGARVVRGGSWYLPCSQATATNRFKLPPVGGDDRSGLRARSRDVGFRCVRNTR